MRKFDNAPIGINDCHLARIPRRIGRTSNARFAKGGGGCDSRSELVDVATHLKDDRYAAICLGGACRSTPLEQNVLIFSPPQVDEDRLSVDLGPAEHYAEAERNLVLIRERLNVSRLHAGERWHRKHFKAVVLPKHFWLELICRAHQPPPNEWRRRTV